METQSKSALTRIDSLNALLTAVLAVFILCGAGSAAAATVTLKVVSARDGNLAFGGGASVTKGAVVSSYKYLINIDNTGTTTQRSPNPGTGCNPADAGYPNSCKWTSIAGAASTSPIFSQGDETNFSASVPISICPAGAPACIPDGRYLISVLADGYKLDGRHFTVGGGVVTWEGKAAGDPASEVKVELQPGQLPDAQIQAAVFEDISPVNSAPDLPAEHGLAGFQGHILDYLGEVTTNVYGDPLCSRYDASGNLVPGSGGRCLSMCYVVNGGVDVGTVTPIGWANPSTPNASKFGRCPTPVVDDATGVITPAIPMYSLNGLTRTGNMPDAAVIEGKVKIPNLGPNRYTLSVTPSDGSGFVQTTTLEGNHDWDAWVMEGATGLDTEFLIGGRAVPGDHLRLCACAGHAVGRRQRSPRDPDRVRHHHGRRRRRQDLRAHDRRRCLDCPARSGAACRAQRSTSRSSIRGSR